jgi:hypothetical protein
MTGILAVLAGGVSSGPPTLDEKTVTRGITSTGGGAQNYVGYYTALSLGAISNNTSNIYSNTIDGIYFYEAWVVDPPLGVVNRSVYFVMNGTHSNSGWTTLRIGSTDYARTDAVFWASGGKTTWRWDLAIPDPLTSTSPGPFSSASVTVKWT